MFYVKPVILLKLLTSASTCLHISATEICLPWQGDLVTMVTKGEATHSRKP